MRKWFIVASIAAVVWSSAAMAEEAKPLTLERVFASPALSGPAPRSVKLSPDGKWLTSLRARPDDRDRFDLWALDTVSGTDKMLVDSTKLGTSGELSEAEKMQRERTRIGGTKGIVAYDWAPDSKAILVPVDGDLFIADLDGKVTRVTNSPAGELDASVSPKGGFVSFVRDQNLIVLDRATGKERALTSDGKGTLSWGVAEFVAQEEIDRYRGAWWSPDDSRLAVARVDESGVDIVSRAAIGAEGTTVFDQRYPRAGKANAVVDLYVINADGSGQVKVDLGSNPDIYLARVDWAAGGKTLLVQRQSRDQKRLDLLSVNPETGASKVLFSETATNWINLHDNLRELKDGSLLWTSERDGFSHLYHVKGGKWSQLTKGPWMVRSIAGVDEAKGLIYFTANRETPLEQQLYAVPLAGGVIKQVTESGWWHTAVMDRAANRAIIARSNPSQPGQVYLADAAGKRISWIEENALGTTHPYAPYLASHTAPIFGTIKAADGSTLHTKLLTPKIETGKTYPVLVIVYGGPGAGRQVTGQWGGPLQQYLVQQGWVVFSVDGRGTPDRGRAFEGQIHEKMGSVEVADQLAGVAWLKTQPFVDPKKIAVYGWSYGGYMTLKLLEAAPGTFAAGVSGAPVTKWELYDTHYTERYMGHPSNGAYPKAGALGDAGKIADPLLLIHGMADDNVVFENSTALMAKLQGAAAPFETMVYPGQTHSVGGPKISVHLWTTILTFLNRNVKNKD
ncbi:MAG: DPP IV N-terminal domain-containing protein [Sphingomonadaceae bacterium]